MWNQESNTKQSAHTHAESNQALSLTRIAGQMDYRPEKCTAQAQACRMSEKLPQLPTKADTKPLNTEGGGKRATKAVAKCTRHVLNQKQKTHTFAITVHLQLVSGLLI